MTPTNLLTLLAVTANSIEIFNWQVLAAPFALFNNEIITHNASPLWGRRRNP
jgi:hypothetical protein